jgi:hypothetical protein
VLNNLKSWPEYTDNGFLSPTRPGEKMIYHADLLVQVRNGQFVEVNPQLKSGPADAPDFWDVSKIFDWAQFYCQHTNLFPSSTNSQKESAVYYRPCPQ